jgi:NAD(P)-dependent dehydrogenase (short-subunit alcohol dehydrogenase family)
VPWACPRAVDYGNAHAAGPIARGAAHTPPGGDRTAGAVIAFLFRDDASQITGTTLHVDGGRVGMSVG